MSTGQPVPPPALIAEATKRAGLIWVKTPAGGRARPAWHVWQDGAAYLLTGPGEQPLPAVRDGGRVTVLVPGKESRGLLVSWEADVSIVAPGSSAWQQVTGLLAAGRLNAAAAADTVAPAARWAATCTVYRLQPAGTTPARAGGRPGGRGTHRKLRPAHGPRPAPSPAHRRTGRPAGRIA